MEKIGPPFPLPVSPIDRWAGNSFFISPFGQGHRAALMFVLDVSSAVCCLGFLKSPYAVLRAVRSIVVGSFHRVLCAWSRPHVRRKVIEGLPTLAHKDSSASVVLEVLGSWVCAPVDDSRPDSMFSRPRCTMGAQSIGVAPRKLLDPDASARPNKAMHQVCRCRELCFSACALANPSSASTRCVFTTPERGQSFKNNSSEVGGFCHKAIVMNSQSLAGFLFMRSI